MAGPSRGSSVRTRDPQSSMTRSTPRRASLRKASSSEIGAACAERSVGGLQHPFDRKLGLLQQLARGLEADDPLLEQLQRAVQIEILLLQGPDNRFQALEFLLKRPHPILPRGYSPRRSQSPQRVTNEEGDDICFISACSAFSAVNLPEIHWARFPSRWLQRRRQRR